MKSLVVTFGVIVIIFFSGCDNSDKNNDESDTNCTRGEVKKCRCPDGTYSTKVCITEDKYTDCECDETVVCNDPGELFECDCPNGGKGVQVCLANGKRGACNCPDSGRCCHDLGTCIPKDIVVESTSKSMAEGLGEDTCGSNSGLLCVPDDLAAGNIPEFCKSVLEMEGRCLPDCLPEVAEMTTPLPQSSCPEYFVCVPCYDPFTGAMTDACLTVNDTPRSVGKSFDSCCESNGYCVPVDLLDLTEDQLAALGKDSCDPDQNLMCVPKVFIEDPDFVPDPCTSIANSEGRCLPECLPSITELPVSLPQDVCPDSFVCAPCFDPFTGELTDACTLTGDPGPAEEPVSFAACCEGLGYCVPRQILTEDQSSMLNQDSCEKDKELLCVPSIFTDADGYQPKTCISLNRNEGRCLPDCLPEVVDSPTPLPQDICPEHFVCAPCYDPATMNLTDACTIDTDTPQRNPLGYDTCCYGLGSCIPMRQIPEDQHICLDEDVCTSNADLLCVPNEMIDFENYTPDFCTSIYDQDGYCVPKCSPDAKKLAFSQDVCRDDFVCVPYANPSSGAENECNFNFPDNKKWGDQLEFPKCCEAGAKSYGTCIPRSLMPEDIDNDLISKLPRDTCPSDKNYVCVPDSMAEEPDNITFKKCASNGVPIDIVALVDLMNLALTFLGQQPIENLEELLEMAGLTTTAIPESGICISNCLLIEQEDLDTESLDQDICDDNELCVPCSIMDLEIPGSCD
ncbi:MAG: hypothetical protein JXA30_13230 [Deltaproteobacteria bacterium]|nr:hypothetical protein [Deltaproteobacteria bacterium]